MERRLVSEMNACGVRGGSWKDGICGGATYRRVKVSANANGERGAILEGRHDRPRWTSKSGGSSGTVSVRAHCTRNTAHTRAVAAAVAVAAAAAAAAAAVWGVLPV